MRLKTEQSARALTHLNADNVVYAKYGVHLDGKAFERARIGGVTRAITAPITDTELLGGVSVGIKTSGKNTILDGGIFQTMWLYILSLDKR